MSVAAEKVSTSIVEEFMNDYVLRVSLEVSRGRVKRIYVSYKPTWSKGNPLEFSIELGDDEIILKRGEATVIVKDPIVKSVWFKSARKVKAELKRGVAETVDSIVRDVKAIIGRAVHDIEIDY